MKQLDSARKKVGHGKITRGTFRNEDGAIDLASIMVGIIVIGLIGGVIAATVFAVIPWSQDNAAKQQLNSIVQAENAYMGLSSAVPSPLAAGYTPNSYTDSPGLANASLLVTGPAYCAVTINSGKGFQGFSASGSGSIFTVTDANTNPTSFTGTLPSACSGITAASSTTSSSSTTAALSTTATWTKKSTANPGSLTAVSGNLATQLSVVSGSSAAENLTTNSGTSWASTATGLGADTAASSQNGTYLLTSRSTKASGTGPVYFSTNGGTSWSQLTALGSTYVSAAWISNDGQKIIAAGGGGGGATAWVKMSTDGGATFTQLTQASSATTSYSSWSGLAVSSDGSHIYAAESNNQTGPYLHVSTNGGSTWTATAMAGISGVSTDSTGQHVVAGTSTATGKVWVSSNYGSSFTQVLVGTATNTIRSIGQQAVSSDGNTMVAAGSEGNVWLSRDAGQTWTAQTGPAGSSLAVAVSSDGSSFLAWNGTTAYTGQ